MERAKLRFNYFTDYHLYLECDSKITDNTIDYISTYIAELCEDLDWEVEEGDMKIIINKVADDSEFKLQQITWEEFNRLKLEERFFSITD